MEFAGKEVVLRSRSSYRYITVKKDDPIQTDDLTPLVMETSRPLKWTVNVVKSMSDSETQVTFTTKVPETDTPLYLCTENLEWRGPSCESKAGRDIKSRIDMVKDEVRNAVAKIQLVDASDPSADTHYVLDFIPETIGHYLYGKTKEESHQVLDVYLLPCEDGMPVPKLCFFVFRKLESHKGWGIMNQSSGMWLRSASWARASIMQQGGCNGCDEYWILEDGRY